MAKLITEENVKTFSFSDYLSRSYEFKNDRGDVAELYGFSNVLSDIRDAGGISFPSAHKIISELMEISRTGDEVLLLTTPSGTEVYLCADGGYDSYGSEAYSVGMSIIAYSDPDEWGRDGGVLCDADVQWGYTMYPSEADERRGMRIAYGYLVDQWEELMASTDWEELLS